MFFTPFLDGEAFPIMLEIVIMYVNIYEQYTSKNKRSVLKDSLFIFLKMDFFLK